MQKPLVYTSRLQRIMSHKASVYYSYRKAEATFLADLMALSGSASPASQRGWPFLRLLDPNSETRPADEPKPTSDIVEIRPIDVDVGRAGMLCTIVPSPSAQNAVRFIHFLPHPLGHIPAKIIKPKCIWFKASDWETRGQGN